MLYNIYSSFTLLDYVTKIKCGASSATMFNKILFHSSDQLLKYFVFTWFPHQHSFLFIFSEILFHVLIDLRKLNCSLYCISSFFVSIYEQNLSIQLFYVVLIPFGQFSCSGSLSRIEWKMDMKQKKANEKKFKNHSIRQ